MMRALAIVPILAACASPSPPPESPARSFAAGVPVDPPSHMGFPPVVPPFLRGPHPGHTETTAETIKPPPPDDPPSPEDCLPVPVPHRGYDKWHNWCADVVLENEETDCDRPIDEEGCDVLVRGRRFDGRRGGVLFEVKTAAWSRYGDHLKLMKYWEYRREAINDLERAASCGFGYFFAVADAELFEALDKTVKLPGLFVHVPQCERSK